MDKAHRTECLIQHYALSPFWASSAHSLSREQVGWGREIIRGGEGLREGYLTSGGSGSARYLKHKTNSFLLPKE